MVIKIETLVKDKVKLGEEIEEGFADIKAANSKNETMKKTNNALEKNQRSWKAASSSAKHKTMLNNQFNNVNISKILLPNASPKCIYNTL